MGYYTFIDITYNVETDTPKDDQIQTWIHTHEVGNLFEDLYPGGACGQIKNLAPDPDIIELSTAFPEVLFTLQGTGEEPEDLWRTYFRGGLAQEASATVTYPEFDPDMLATPDFEPTQSY